MTRTHLLPILALSTLVAACDDSDKAGSAAAEAKSADAKTPAKADAKTQGDAPAAAVDAPGDDAPTDLCKAFDRKAVAAAFGWSGMSKATGVGTSAKGITSRVCGYAAKDAPTEGHFGVTFSNDTTFEARHAGFGVAYEPHDPIDGLETKVAKNDEIIILQVLGAKGLRIITDASIEGTKPADLEPKLIAATKTLIAALPADPVAVLVKKK